jgi:UDP-N-acetylmuramoyl-L-alanyl-D-glutamate--2,6-diaminopimelate ligase
MGKVVEAYADVPVVTSDNPRTESPHDIIADIMAGMDSPFDVTIIEDRAAAIAWAIRNAGDGDVILIAGKGHENYQLVGSERRDFSDLGTAAASLERLSEARQ